MSFWQFNHVQQGWARANGVEAKPPPPTTAEHDALVAKYAHV